MKLAYTSHVLAAGMSECGRWQSNYRTLHQDIINDKVEGGKYLISIAPPQGLADRLGGYITHFLFALLTDRAYLQITLPSDAPMSAAYDCKFINSNLLHHLESKSDPFSYSFGDFQEELLALPVVGYDAINKYVAEHPKTTARPVNLKKNHGEYLNAGPGMSSKQRIAIRKKNKVLFTQSDFNALPYSDIKRVFFLGNRGFSYAMFDNPHHNHTLSAMGLTRENAFRCVFDYLFGFNVQHNCAGGCRDMRSAVLAQQAAGGAVIGVHVRVGDHVFSDADADVETEIGISEEQAAKLLAIAEPFLHCALSLRKELSLLRGGRPTAPILFMSDSVLLRKLVVGQLGTGVVISDTAAVPRHVADKTQSREQANEALVLAARELELLALCDYHVISERSGFGQKAAFLNRKSTRDHIFYPSTEESMSCQLERPSSAAVVASKWSGV